MLMKTYIADCFAQDALDLLSGLWGHLAALLNVKYRTLEQLFKTPFWIMLKRYCGDQIAAWLRLPTGDAFSNLLTLNCLLIAISLVPVIIVCGFESIGRLIRNESKTIRNYECVMAERMPMKEGKPGKKRFWQKQPLMVKYAADEGDPENKQWCVLRVSNRSLKWISGLDTFPIYIKGTKAKLVESVIDEYRRIQGIKVEKAGIIRFLPLIFALNLLLIMLIFMKGYFLFS